MNRAIKILLIIFAITSCTNTTPKTSAKDANLSDTVPQKDSLSSVSIQKEANAKLGCYYELDDKYSNSSSEQEIEKWWSEKLELVKASGIQNDIWSREGGGPNGAEWNTYTDLYFVALFQTKAVLNKDSIDNKAIILVNEKPIEHKLIGLQAYPHGILVSFMIKKDVWTPALREVVPGDYVALYGEEQVELCNKGEIIFAAPMDIGEILKINVELEQMSAVGYFHIAYGE